MSGSVGFGGDSASTGVLILRRSEDASANRDHVVRQERGVGLLPVAHVLEVDVDDAGLARLRVYPSHLHIVAPEPREPSRGGHGARHGALALDLVASRLVA